MIVVSDVSPLISLAVVGFVNVLQSLYRRVIVPLVPLPKPILDSLIARAGFWVSQQLYERVLQVAGEV